MLESIHSRTETFVEGGDIPLSTVSRRSEGSQDGDRTAAARSARVTEATAAAARASALVHVCRHLNIVDKICSHSANHRYWLYDIGVSLCKANPRMRHRYML